MALPAGCSQRDATDWRKEQSLQDGCRLFTWKFFFHIQQQGHEKAEEPLSAYVVVRLMPSNDPVQVSKLCGDFGRPYGVFLELIPQLGDHFRTICNHQAAAS
ncbi:hypothetical protein TNCV_3697161 [Trichonephila clavipes]|uniref:Uncharacterized protein n=1 Tax=Trichonephila clavipes TaxID=2585209 RepID=A0A8X6VEK0_TRICX|nr:hypothetical protein TNCV_3697161 [Trichonephila clavipes]